MWERVSRGPVGYRKPDLERDVLIKQEVFLDGSRLLRIFTMWRRDYSLSVMYRTPRIVDERGLTLDANNVLLTRRLRLLDGIPIHTLQHARLEMHELDLCGEEREPCDQ